MRSILIIKEKTVKKVKAFFEKKLSVKYFFPDDRRLKFSARTLYVLLIQYQRMHFVSQNPAILISFLEK